MANLNTLLASYLLVSAIVPSSIARAEVVSGSIDDWCESDAPFNLVAQTSGVQLNTWWSIGDFEQPNTAFFYGNNSNAEAAIAQEIPDITEVKDASKFSYRSDYIGPLSAGAIVLYRDSLSGYYGAIKIDSILPASEAMGCPYEQFVLNGTWYFQSDGTPNFSN